MSAALSDEFRNVTTLKLKKDEYKTYIIRYDKVEKFFFFRWTLYVNNGLVVLQSYDRFPAQHVLKLGYRNNSFKVHLKTKDTYHKTPYILIKFDEFDPQKKLATLKMFLYDESLDIKMEEIKEKRD